MIGTILARYRIVAKLGTGGMGEVYLADDTVLGRRVAIKFIPADYAADAAALERFKREAKAAAALNHPNIVTIHDIGTYSGRPYIVMEHVDGERLTKAIEAKNLGTERVLEIAIQIFGGLQAAHEAGVIHRDIKPDNILIDSDGRVRILDFGLAKLRGAVSVTSDRVTLGTVRYMSPEQITSADVDARSDLFSAGVVLYEMIAGAHPFAGEHQDAVLYAIATQEIKPLLRHNGSVSDGLQRIVSRLLAKSPEQRYPDAKAAMVDLRLELAGSSPRGDRRRDVLRPRGWVTAGVAAVLLLVAGVWWGRRDDAPGPPVPEGPSIAVLPLVNMSGDPDDDYFSDGLSEELANALVKIPTLRVTGRTSAFSFKGRNEDLRTIAEKLGVGHLLEGTVRKSGDRVRIDIQLVEAADGFRVWTQSYDRALDDMIAVQDDIARSVARKLHVTLLATEAQTPRPSAAAYDLVLRARFALQNPTAEGIEQARGILERALALAPDYAPAWAEMGLLHFREYEVVNTHADRQRATEDALKALTRALELDRNLAAAHARMATVHRRVWAFEQAQASITRALALEPGNPIVVGSAAFLYYVLGRSDEAIAHYQHLLRIDPLLPVGYWFLSESYILAGRLDEAMAPLNALRELTPDYWQACITEGNIHLLRGEAEQARAAFARLRALHPTGDDDVVFHRAIVDHTAGDSASSTAAAADFEARWGREDPFRCAEIRGWRGETDAAFEWLERAFAVRDPVLHTVRTDVYLRPLHADPRWNALLDRIGLPSD